MHKQVMLVTRCGCCRLETIPAELDSWRVPLRQGPFLTHFKGGPLDNPSVPYREFKYEGMSVDLGTRSIPFFVEVTQ